jgi:hypothetical protein
LGLGQGALTPALARVACRAGLETSFAQASDLLDETLGVAVPSDAVRRVTARGAVAEAEQRATLAQAQQGQVQPDAAGPPCWWSRLSSRPLRGGPPQRGRVPDRPGASRCGVRPTRTLGRQSQLRSPHCHRLIARRPWHHLKIERARCA